MKEQLISFETAKLAKEKCFNWECYASYNINGEDFEDTTIRSSIKDVNSDMMFDLYSYNPEKGSERCDVPTQSLLQKWLRENHKLIISIIPSLDGGYFNGEYDFEIRDTEFHLSDDTNFNSYEHALECGLQEALKII